jgi:2-dehydro-3-deoxyphosphooctonate aldolase (KDO 8-P synthase)
MNIQDIPQINIQMVTFLLAGPCAIEGEEMAMRIAEKLIGITTNYKFLTFLRVRLKSFKN